jgi:hypothetical protein
MNLFKALASGNRKFSEELSSSMLAWLLNPNLEHGLGSAFASKFIRSVGQSAPDATTRGDFEILADEIEPVLRTDGDSNATFDVMLELCVSGGCDFIDVVFRVGNWWIAIENKIHDASISQNKLQLSQQYKGLRQLIDERGEKNQRVVSVFLVPSAASIGKERVQQEYAAWEALAPGDFKALLTWRAPELVLSENDEQSPCRSILGMLRELLHDEQTAQIAPLSEYLRHTLKAFGVFIDSEFKGYRYGKATGSGGLNERTTELVKFDQLRLRDFGFVGVSGGVPGLLQMKPNEIREKAFQYSTEDMSDSRNWLPLTRFVELAAWLLGGDPPEVEWDGKFRAEVLYRIARAYGDKVFVGIKGGSNSLINMEPEELASVRWSIGHVQLTRQWIPGPEFVAILDSKGATEGKLWA